ncbi:WD domain-containing protein [Cucurbitaria berberidis CBS 394.84]|uniref:WD domain-containing protein n=1 Tax=Cucurbitaria berberidis CBS 394.84 TaxID=1168544 RepID=A0A9P4L7H3_9PLEO|nr:WD domain-containing protein [Cucurbitaria berberidis CBS 394.84]KAF1844955.1 WD domain-containing protein [Cucurbitaria berberidis CBS 394.84]
MSRSDDPGHYFQTTSALEQIARKAAKSNNTNGNPIKLPSKILAIIADPQDDNQIYVAEAAGCVKRINIEVGQTSVPHSKTRFTNKVSATFSGPQAPLTSVAVSLKSDTIFAGCWDKSIWSWTLSTRKPGKRFQGHSDFVKDVIAFTLQGKEVLVSASQDASMIVWDVATGEKLRTIKGHTRGILALAIDPADYEPNKASVTLFSAGSDREIRRWTIGLSSAVEIQPSPLIAHETSVDALHFDSDGDLWTASADKTAKCLSRGREWEEDSAFEHPDFVRDVAVDEDGGWVITACRDEEVRVWDKGSGKLHHTFTGHFEEVIGLLLLPRQRLVSVSIDATIRLWSLKSQDLAKAITEAEDERLGKEKEKVPEQKEGMLTIEEEAELAELLEDSE